MLGWLFWGFVIGRTTAKLITIVVGYLNKAKAKNELKNNKIRYAIVRKISKDPSIKHIKLDGLDEDGKEVKIQIDTEDYDASEIKRDAVIYV